jgi:peroxiredoxin
MGRRFMVGLAFLLSGTVGLSGEFNKVLSVGDAAPAFEGLDGTDGFKHGLTDFKDQSAVVVIFTCNSCPVANLYEERIAALAKKYADGPGAKVAVVAINPNTIPDDRMDKMIERAKKKKYNYLYLSDPTQKTAKAYGAMYTPEFFVLDRDRKIAYMGSLDDTSKAEDVKEQFVAAALDAILAGKKPEKGETLARGCKVRYTVR